MRTNFDLNFSSIVGMLLVSSTRTFPHSLSDFALAEYILLSAADKEAPVSLSLLRLQSALLVEEIAQCSKQWAHVEPVSACVPAAEKISVLYSAKPERAKDDDNAQIPSDLASILHVVCPSIKQRLNSSAPFPSSHS